MTLKWRSIYSVNVKEIDEQHKKIFNIINRVSAIKKGTSKEDKMKIINELKDYGIYHLNKEEKYFEKFNYLDKAPHIKQHNEYREKISEFTDKCLKSKQPENIKELSVFLRNWWINHIQNIDIKYSDFFNEKGLY